MNKFTKFLAVIIAILVLSVVLTPLFYSLTQPYFKFEKIFNRLIMIFGVLAALGFVIWNQRKKDSSSHVPTWREYGFDFSQKWRRLFGLGFLAGAFTVLFIVGFEITFGPPSVRQPLEFLRFVEWFFTGVGGGLAVGVIEEFFFRGFIYTQLQKKISVWLAVVLANAFYALCHFFDNGQIFIPQNPTMYDAIRLLFGYLEPLARRPFDILPEFAGLFLFGVLLNLAFIRTGSLFLSIGLHTGAVFLIKFQHAFVEKGSEVYHSFYGNRPYYDGPFEWVSLAFLGCLIWMLAPRIAPKSLQK
ncbi:MAG: CPBP family intramembrane metalloprotease [Candidatus Omnitrophica bacterium]|nr:CPBP family intramembrane metalloprotease [Candidatus Omnitrophota bacterium]